MNTEQQATILQAVTTLDDQWLIFAERNAFVSEAYARLLADHPHLPAETIQGGEHAIRQLRQESSQIGEQLAHLHQLTKEIRSNS